MISGAGLDLGGQAVSNVFNGCDAFDAINWGSVARSGLIGGATGGATAVAFRSLRVADDVSDDILLMAHKKKRPAKNADRKGHTGGNDWQKHSKVQGHGGGKNFENPNKRKKPNMNTIFQPGFGLGLS